MDESSCYLSSSKSSRRLTTHPHLQRPSSVPSIPSPSAPPRPRSRNQLPYDIEFAEFELPPSLPPRPKPQSNAQAQDGVRFADRVLPTPVPSRSVLRFVPNQPANAGRARESLVEGSRDAETLNQIRAHLPQSFYAPSLSAREVEMRKMPTSFYAPPVAAIRGQGRRDRGSGRCANVARVNDEERVRDERSNRGRGTRGAGESELLEAQHGRREADQPEMMDAERGRNAASGSELLGT